MIYLLQDCYLDENNEVQKVLKIGYSSKSFKESRKSQYDTHNFGYKFLGEKEGSTELESYLHNLFKNLRLDKEWFRYSQDIIDKFWKVSENDVDSFISQDYLNEYIRYYILENLIPSVNYLKETYLEGILEELHEKSKEYPELEYNENLYRKEILEIFEFVSSKEREYFENLNFDDKETKNLLSNTDLNFSQIVGRQRDKENPFKNNIVIFYKLIRKIIPREEFEEEQEKRRKSTGRLLNLYQKGDLEEKVEYVKKLRAGIIVSQYSDDFVSISSKTGAPVHNTFIELAHERAWEVSQRDYQDKITVTKALESINNIEIVSLDDSDQLLFEEFKLNFDSINIFAEKMEIYCKYMDKALENKYLQDLISSYTSYINYRKYYDFYGTKGCRAKKYREVNLEAGMIQGSVLYEERDLIIKEFQIGGRYSKAYIREKLSGIYSSLGISKVPRATDLKEYFEIERTKITNSQTKKKEEGFRILSVKS